MQDFHCLFNAKDSNTRFSLENRLVFDTADAAPEETPASESERWSETKRLDYLNKHRDAFDNLIDFNRPIEEQSLPDNEDEMIKYHLARNVVRTDEDIDKFFETSADQLGFTVKNGVFSITGKNDKTITNPTDADPQQSLFEFLDTNLESNATTAGFESTGKENVSPTNIALDILGEIDIAKELYEFLDQNYTSPEEFKTDMEKVITLREMAKVKRDYQGGRESVLTHTRIKESELAFETRVQIVRDRATTPTEAALLWYAINFYPEISYENLNLEDIFNPGDDIEENGIAIVNGRLVVAYKPKDKQLEEGVAYEYATYGYNQYDLDPAIAQLRDTNNEYGGKKGSEIADMLENGVEIFEGIKKETEGMIESYDESPEFKQNYALLQRIMLIPTGMLNSEIGLQGDAELGLDPIENIPDFAKEGTWYFGRIGGKFYARTIHFIDRGECYVFDMTKGWERTNRIPEMEFAMPELYTKKDDGTWEVNQRALEMTKSLGLNPDEVLVRTLNVLCKNSQSRAALLDAFAFSPIPEATIPFPQLDKVEILLDEESYNDSLTNIQDILHTAYVQRFPGLDSATAHWLAGDIGQRFLQGLMLVDSRTGKPYVVDQNGNPIDSEHKYILSSKKVADNFVDAFRPDVEFTAEKQFSEATQARIDQIHEYIENMYSGFFGKINTVLSTRFGVVGETLGQLAEEWARQPLGDVWKLAEELSVEWETLESEKGETLTFKKFMIIYGIQALGKLKDPSQIKEGTFLDRLSKLFGQKSGQSQNPQAAPEQTQEQPPDMTDPAQWEVVKDELETLQYSFGNKRGQRLLTDADVDAIVTGNTDKKFTTREAHEAIAARIKLRMEAAAQDSAEKAALKQEYEYYKDGTVPPEYASATASTVGVTGEPATPGQSPSEISTGQPGPSPDNAVEIDRINTNTTYRDWHEATKQIAISSGVLHLGEMRFSNETDTNIKVEVEYDAPADNKKDTYDYTNEVRMADLIDQNNGELSLEDSSDRPNDLTDPSYGYTARQIKKITIYKGVKIKNLRLNVN